ncbi:MAG: UDP-N-acetylglucosamine--N-acetylmuramyl-(pentapeptide) pyrophosphoryl-undecaprenol N-acetylglucosamine transferase [Synergistaceae bacterium]|nr:UDP-N-acetylglucosamine--N-acetylmuramyl-(pentapeptide) pyrophosphoryl-undecaprenol N-acetylglucosamine transferase [Synergistaceae bacterium]
MMTNKILIFSGGTGGHIIPAIMFGKKLQSENKIVKWVCGSRKLEREIYNALEIQPMLLSLSGSPLGSKSITKIFTRFVDLIKSFFKTSKYIKDFKPDEIFLFGGYISFAPLLIAKLKKIPVTLHEQNAVAGKVTKLASKLGAKILTGWPNCEGIKNFEYFGVPVREPERITKSEALKILNLDINENSKIIGIAGGSLGSTPLNKLLIEVSDICRDYEFVFLSHEAENENNRHFILPQWDMNPFFSICDVLVCRAGASTLAEALKWEIPTVTIPWPGSADNHQEKNSDEFVKLAKNSHKFNENDSPESLAKILQKFINP